MPTATNGRTLLALHAAATLLGGLLLAALAHALLGVAWPFALVFSVPLAAVGAPMEYAARYFCRAMPLERGTALYTGASAVLASIFTAAAWAAIGFGWSRALERLGLGAGARSRVALAALLVGFGALAYLLSIAIHYLVIAAEDATAAERRVLESEIAARDAELRALRSQIDPHFLFNSLNSIVGLIGGDPAGAREMCRLLADFLRESVVLGRAERIPLERELNLARRYLDIEHARFGDRLRVVMAIDPGAAAAGIPPLLLQPLAENAVRHGIATCVDGGRVAITAVRRGDTVSVEIVNPRDPDARASHSTGLGLDLVRRRLAAAYGDDASLIVAPAEAGYRVTVIWPAGDGGRREDA